MFYPLFVAVTNARFASLHGLPVALWPFDDARSSAQIRALVTSGHSLDATHAAGFRQRLGGGRCAWAAIR